MDDLALHRQDLKDGQANMEYNPQRPLVFGSERMSAYSLTSQFRQPYETALERPLNSLWTQCSLTRTDAVFRLLDAIQTTKQNCTEAPRNHP